MLLCLLTELYFTSSLSSHCYQLWVIGVDGRWSLSKIFVWLAARVNIKPSFLQLIGMIIAVQCKE